MQSAALPCTTRRCASEVEEKLGVHFIATLQPARYCSSLLAVALREFIAMVVDAIRARGGPDFGLFDVRHALPRDAVADGL